MRMSRDTYLDAWAAALFAGRLAEQGGSLLDVSRAAAAAPSLEVLAFHATCSWKVWRWSSPTDAPPQCPCSAARSLRSRAPRFQTRRCSGWGWLASRAANLIWEYDRGVEIGMRAVALARDSGALEALAVVDNACGQAAAVGGDFARAALFISELDTLKEATNTRIAPHAALALAGLRGNEVGASGLIEGAMAHATGAGQGTAVQYALWANSVLMNGLGRYEEALEAAVQASEHMPELFIASWASCELVEAATRTDHWICATDAVIRLGKHIEACDAGGHSGMHARSSALLCEGDEADSLYREAVHDSVEPRFDRTLLAHISSTAMAAAPEPAHRRPRAAPPRPRHARHDRHGRVRRARPRRTPRNW